MTELAFPDFEVGLVTFGVVVEAGGVASGSIGEHFGRFGVPLDLHFGIGVALGVHFGVGGYPWTRSARRPFQGPPCSVTVAPFYAILELKGFRKGSPNGAKIVKKTIQKSIEFLVGFLNGFWIIFAQCWGCFWDPAPSK